MHPSPDTGPQSGPFGRQDPSLPQVFGRYLLVQRLSRGGMGEIFLAKHGLAGFEKLAVIKKVLPHLAADEQFIARFVDEAQVAIKLQHVNVAQVFEVGRVGNEYFLALEYIEGRDLRRTLALLGHRHRRMPVDLALFIARELSNGLAYAHRRTTSDGASLNLVHCDISPPNVLVSFEGETKVIDFGIAKSAMRASTTDPKLGFGKFGYMAPEQLIRGGVVDHRTDIYAAGVVLFELLTGTRLYEAGPQPDYRALARKVARGEHPLPSQVDRKLAQYDELVATALRPRPEDRYQSAAELRDAIQQCLVAVNPTISTDQLGAYMRELFSDEMTAQRELHERVASAHLADFQDQFQDQTIATVSFALAQLPLKPPDATGPVRRPTTQPPAARGRNTGPHHAPRVPTGPNVVVQLHSGNSGPNAAPSLSSTGTELAPPSPTLDNLAPPSSAIDPSQIETESETLVGGGFYARALARRRLWLIAALTAFAVIAVFAVGGMMGGDGRAPSAQSQTQAATPPKKQITVEPIPINRPVGETPNEVGEIEMTPDDVAANQTKPVADPAAPPVHRAPRETAHHAASRRDPRPPPAAPPVAPFTREQLGQKFQQVRREYDDYKAKFGSRLEKEWGELATFIQYMPPSADDAGRHEAARRLDEFHSRMRE